MTGNNQAVKHFLLLFLFLGVSMLVFLYVAKGKIEAETATVAVVQREARRSAQFTDDSLVRVSIGAASVSAEVAESDAKKALGLGNREKLAGGTGMLFVFKEPGVYRFWNRNMRFPIDIIWIRDGTVVDLWEHLPEYAAEKDFTVTPKAAANFILEVPDGFIREYAMHVADKATYEPEKN